MCFHRKSHKEKDASAAHVRLRVRDAPFEKCRMSFPVGHSAVAERGVIANTRIGRAVDKRSPSRTEIRSGSGSNKTDNSLPERRRGVSHKRNPSGTRPLLLTDGEQCHTTASGPSEVPGRTRPSIRKGGTFVEAASFQWFGLARTDGRPPPSFPEEARSSPDPFEVQGP